MRTHIPGVMDVLIISLTMIYTGMCISKHHVVCLKYIDFLFMSPNSVKLGEKTGRFWVGEDGVFSPGGRCMPWHGDWAAESLLGAQRDPEHSEGCTGDLHGR